MILSWGDYREVEPHQWPWRYFEPWELRSRGDGRLKVNTDALNMLDQLRHEHGHALTINSAYRSPYWNAVEGGAVASRHLFADAFDISINGKDRWALYELAQRVGFSGFGFYYTFLHVDTWRARQWGRERWNS